MRREAPSVGEREGGELTTLQHWTEVHEEFPRLGLPSSLNVGVRNVKAILKREIRPGMRVLEIGFAPGKMLAWVGKRLQATVAGVDFADNGVRAARALFTALELEGDLRHENVFQTSFEDESFDFVYSLGVIEHFANPAPLVRRHVELVKGGGVVVIAIPNYGGLYGRLQRYLDEPNLALHNLEIMSALALERLVPRDLISRSATCRAGRIDPWILSLKSRLPAKSARLLAYVINSVGLLQPINVGSLSPLLLLRIQRKEKNGSIGEIADTAADKG